MGHDLHCKMFSLSGVGRSKAESQVGVLQDRNYFLLIKFIAFVPRNVEFSCSSSTCMLLSFNLLLLSSR